MELNFTYTKQQSLLFTKKRNGKECNWTKIEREDITWKGVYCPVS